MAGIHFRMYGWLRVPVSPHTYLQQAPQKESMILVNFGIRPDPKTIEISSTELAVPRPRLPAGNNPGAPRKSLD